MCLNDFRQLKLARDLPKLLFFTKPIFQINGFQITAEGNINLKISQQGSCLAYRCVEKGSNDLSLCFDLKLCCCFYKYCTWKDCSQLKLARNLRYLLFSIKPLFNDYFLELSSLTSVEIIRK